MSETNTESPVPSSSSYCQDQEGKEDPDSGYHEEYLTSTSQSEPEHSLFPPSPLSEGSDVGTENDQTTDEDEEEDLSWILEEGGDGYDSDMSLEINLEDVEYNVQKSEEMFRRALVERDDRIYARKLQKQFRMEDEEVIIRTQYDTRNRARQEQEEQEDSQVELIDITD